MEENMNFLEKIQHPPQISLYLKTKEGYITSL